MDRQYVVFLGLGFELLGLTVTLVYLGSMADERYGWKGFGVAGGAVIAMIAWLIHVMMVLRKLDTDDNSSDPTNTPQK